MDKKGGVTFTLIHLADIYICWLYIVIFSFIILIKHTAYAQVQSDSQYSKDIDFHKYVCM